MLHAKTLVALSCPNYSVSYFPLDSGALETIIDSQNLPQNFHILPANDDLQNLSSPISHRFWLRATLQHFLLKFNCNMVINAHHPFVVDYSSLYYDINYGDDSLNKFRFHLPPWLWKLSFERDGVHITLLKWTKPFLPRYSSLSIWHSQHYPWDRVSWWQSHWHLCHVHPWC